MSLALALAAGALAAASAYLDTLTTQIRTTLAEVMMGSGGVFLLALGLLGVGVLLYDAILLVVRLVRRFRRRAGVDLLHTRAAQARSLVAGGAAPTEVVRQTGLARDALTLLATPDAGAPRRVPAAVPGIPTSSSAGSTYPGGRPAHAHAQSRASLVQHRSPATPAAPDSARGPHRHQWRVA